LCGEACKSCPGACSKLSGLCKNCGAEFKHFMERPLSAYVILSILLSLYTLYQCQDDMGSVKGCSSNLLYILMGFSVIYIVFVIYMQCMVWKEIMVPDRKARFIDGDDPTQLYKGEFGSAAMGLLKAGSTVSAAESEQPTVPEEKVAADPGKIIVPKGVVQEAFQKVFLEDLFVLGMFFLLIAVAALAWMGQEAVDTAEPKCDVSPSTASCGTYFFGLAFTFAFMYRCCSCCSSKVTIAKPAHDEEIYEEVPSAPANA